MHVIFKLVLWCSLLSAAYGQWYKSSEFEDQGQADFWTNTKHAESVRISILYKAYACNQTRNDAIGEYQFRSHPPMPMFDPKKIDEMLRGKMIYFLGHSLTLQMFNKLHVAMGSVKDMRRSAIMKKTIDNAPILIPKFEKMHKNDHEVFSTMSGTRFVFNFIERLGEEYIGNRTDNFSYRYWLSKADIIIFETGAYMYDEPEQFKLGVNQTSTRNMEWFLEYLDSLEPAKERFMIHRANYFPTMHCESMKLPLEIHQPNDKDDDPRRWNEFKQINENWAEAIRLKTIHKKSKSHHYHIMDDTFALSLRADSHTLRQTNSFGYDCLHFCESTVPKPSPLMVSVELLYEIVITHDKKMRGETFPDPFTNSIVHVQIPWSGATEFVDHVLEGQFDVISCTTPDDESCYSADSIAGHKLRRAWLNPSFQLESLDHHLKFNAYRSFLIVRPVMQVALASFLSKNTNGDITHPYLSSSMFNLLVKVLSGINAPYLSPSLAPDQPMSVNDNFLGVDAELIQQAKHNVNLIDCIFLTEYIDLSVSLASNILGISPISKFTSFTGSLNQMIVTDLNHSHDADVVSFLERHNAPGEEVYVAAKHVWRIQVDRILFHVI